MARHLALLDERNDRPDATVTLDFALNRLAGIVDKLVVYPENMQANLDRLGGLVHSQRVLIALTRRAFAREGRPTGCPAQAMEG